MLIIFIFDFMLSSSLKTSGEDETTLETSGEDETTLETSGEDETTLETGGEDSPLAIRASNSSKTFFADL